MTPAEVIATHEQLTKWLQVNDAVFTHSALATLLIDSGWVVAPPKNEGEKEI